MSTAGNCPCEGFEHPKQISNPASQSSVAGRVGDFASFRDALLRPLAGEEQLRQWRPSGNDLGLQIVEWWAYLADVLTFYNERILNEGFLGTAVDEVNARNLIRVLGYRPAPGIGASGYAAALLSGAKFITVPQGFQIQSKPVQGEEPQTFEVDEAVAATYPDIVEADPPGNPGVSTGVMLEGDVTGVTEGESLLLVNKTWSGTASDFFSVITVASVSKEKDPRGRTNTRVVFRNSVAPPSALQATDFRLLRPGQSIGAWPYTVDANLVFGVSQVHMAGIARAASPGTFLFFDVSGGSSSDQLAKVTQYSEMIWYANPLSTASPQTPPNAPAVPIPITHSLVTFSPQMSSSLDSVKSQVTMRYDWRDAGVVIAEPAVTAGGAALTLTAFKPTAFPAIANNQELLLEDRNGSGALVTATTAGGGATLDVSLDPALSNLAAPLKILTNVLRISRGKTVDAEVLGSGDPAIAGQEFVLAKSPLTYLASADPASPQPYTSTLRVYVDGIEWKEIASSYEQPADAPVFVTREDSDQKTHVQFGDGIEGARLPSGASIVAYYRYESGASVPEPGAISVMLSQIPGLKGIRNPVAPVGGADPDAADRFRQLAPKSVLTFNRAVSADDYGVIASQTPGVDRARAYWSYDADRQRSLVRIYAGDTPGAVDAARAALQRVMDPNLPLDVRQAFGIPLYMLILVATDPAYIAADVVSSVRDKLVNEETGLFSVANLRIGQTVFRSQIHKACHDAPGVTAVRALFIVAAITVNGQQVFVPISSYRFYAGEGGYFTLPPENLFVFSEAQLG